MVLTLVTDHIAITENCTTAVEENSIRKRTKMYYSDGPTNEDLENPNKKRRGSNDMKIDNSHHILKKIATLYAERLMSDICLVVNETEYPAHRLILCASSNVFQVMLMNRQWSESQQKRIILQESPECFAVFEDFLRYFYTGKIRFYMNSVLGVLTLADKYNVKDLSELCIEYMRRHLAEAAYEGKIITWFQHTLSMAHYQSCADKFESEMTKLWSDNNNTTRKKYSSWDYLRTACKNYIKWNFNVIAEGSDFEHFQPKVLQTLLQQNDLVVSSEISLYRYLVKWLDVQKTQMCSIMSSDLVDCEFLSLINVMMSQIRFPMMRPRELAQLLLSPLVNKYKDFFIEKMAIGIAFHSGEKTEEISDLAKTEDGRLLFTPRLYTSDNWSSSIVIQNYPIHLSYTPRTLMCTTCCSLQEYIADRTSEWVVDFYPKGLWFQKGYLIVWQGSIIIPEEVLKTVRMSITCKNPIEGDGLKVKVGILILGVQHDTEYVMHVAYYNRKFTKHDDTYIINDLIPYEKLNSVDGFLRPNGVPNNTPYLSGPSKNTLKVQVIIIPLCRKLSCIDLPYNSTKSLLYFPLY